MNGELHALINACAHRGAMLCRRKTDNRTTFTCPLHGWTFRNDGTLLKVYAWYDNEMGYSTRLAEAVVFVGDKL